MTVAHEKALREVGLLGQRVVSLAASLARQGIAACEVPQLALVARERRARNVPGLVMHWIDSGEAPEVLKAQALSQRAAPKAKAESGLQSVSLSCPYGWAERHMILKDHDLPGVWNAFRQCHNLTTEEREAHGLIDHRRRGCGRWEVVGDAPGSIPALMFDADAVQHAKSNMEEKQSA